MKILKTDLWLLCVWMLLCCFCGGANAQGWLAGWSQRLPVQVSNAKGVSDLTGAQVKLALTSANASSVFANALSSGNDLRVTDSDGTTVLPYFRQSYNAGTSLATLWFKLGTLLAGQSKTYYLYYGNAGAADTSVFGTGAAGGGTFAKKPVDSGVLALFHFDETAGSTPVDATGTYTATLSGGAAIVAGDGGSFGGVSQSFSSGNNLSLTSSTSSYMSIAGLLDTWLPSGAISLWITPKTTYQNGSSADRIFQKFNSDNSASTYNGIDCTFNATGGLRLDKYVNQTAGNDVQPTYQGVSEAGKTFTGLRLSSHTTTFAAGVPFHLCVTWDRQQWSLYINGKLEAQGVDNVVFEPLNGAFAPFRVGMYYYPPSSPSSYANINVDELCVLNHCPTSEEVSALYNRRLFVPGIEQSGRWQQATRSTLIEPTGQAVFDQYLALEPTLLPPIAGVSTDYQLFFSGNTRSGSRIGRARSTSLLGPYNRLSPTAVISASEASQSVTVWDAANNQYVNFASDAYSGSPSHLVRRTSATGLAGTWSAGTNVLTGGASPTQSWMKVISNCTVHIESATSWKMILECASDTYTGSPQQYQVGEFESTDAGVTWTPYASNPLTALQLWSDGSASHVDWVKSGGVYYAWTHVSARGFGPSNLACATSPDLKNWTLLYGGNPVFSIQGESLGGAGAADQVADVRPYDFTTFFAMIYDVDRNVSGGGHDARIDIAKYPYPFLNLITDLPELTYGTPVTSATVTYSPASSTQSSFTLSVVGSNTGWVVGSTVFSIPASAAVLTQTITDATHATLTIAPNGVAGPFTVTDTTTGQTFSVSAPATSSSVSRRFIH